MNLKMPYASLLRHKRTRQVFLALVLTMLLLLVKPHFKEREKDEEYLMDSHHYHEQLVKDLPAAYHESVARKCLVDPVQDWTTNEKLTAHQARAIVDQECAANPPPSDCSIPKVLHIILGQSFRFHHYVGLKSAFDIYKPWQIYFYTDTHFPVSNPLFTRALLEFSPVLMRSRDAEYVHDVRIVRLEHKSDVVRLETLMRYGGIYMDLDVFAFHPIDELLGHTGLILAPEDDRGLNNGIMLSTRCSTFMRAWYANYTTFDPYDWNEYSIKRPLKMYNENPRDLKLEPRMMVTWDNNTMFERPARNKDYSKTFCKHLFIREKPQYVMNEDDVWEEDSDYGRVCRQILKGENVD